MSNLFEQYCMAKESGVTSYSIFDDEVKNISFCSLMEECSDFEYSIFKVTASYDKMAKRLISEGYDEDSYKIEELKEGVMSTIGNKISSGANKLWQKLVAFYKKVIMQLSTAFRSFETIYNKYSASIDSSELGEFKVKFAKLKSNQLTKISNLKFTDFVDTFKKELNNSVKYDKEEIMKSVERKFTGSSDGFDALKADAYFEDEGDHDWKESKEYFKEVIELAKKTINKKDEKEVEKALHSLESEIKDKINGENFDEEKNKAEEYKKLVKYVAKSYGRYLNVLRSVQTRSISSAKSALLKFAKKAGR